MRIEPQRGCLLRPKKKWSWLVVGAEKNAGGFRKPQCDGPGSIFISWGAASVIRREKKNILDHHTLWEVPALLRLPCMVCLSVMNLSHLSSSRCFQNDQMPGDVYGKMVHGCATTVWRDDFSSFGRDTFTGMVDKIHLLRVHGIPCIILEKRRLPENKQNSETRGVFPKIGVPQNGWFIMKNPIKMDDLGGPPLFLETSTRVFIQVAYKYLGIFFPELPWFGRPSGELKTFLVYHNSTFTGRLGAQISQKKTHWQTSSSPITLKTLL